MGELDQRSTLEYSFQNEFRDNMSRPESPHYSTIKWTRKSKGFDTFGEYNFEIDETIKLKIKREEER